MAKRGTENHDKASKIHDDGNSDCLPVGGEKEPTADLARGRVGTVRFQVGRRREDHDDDDDDDDDSLGDRRRRKEDQKRCV